MAQGQQYFLLSMILLLVLSKCNSYPLFNELPGMEEWMTIFQKISFLNFSSRTFDEISFTK